MVTDELKNNNIELQYMKVIGCFHPWGNYCFHSGTAICDCIRNHQRTQSSLVKFPANFFFLQWWTSWDQLLQFVLQRSAENSNDKRFFWPKSIEQKLQRKLTISQDNQLLKLSSAMKQLREKKKKELLDVNINSQNLGVLPRFSSLQLRLHFQMVGLKIRKLKLNMEMSLG